MKEGEEMVGERTGNTRKGEGKRGDGVKMGNEGKDKETREVG